MWAVPRPPPQPFILPAFSTRGFSRRPSVTAAVNPTNSDSDEKSPSKEISGSDVLWALQRATAAKKRNQPRDRRKTTKKKKMSDGEETDGGEEGEAAASGEVRPIRIDSEWGTRLADLEDRLRQLSRLI